MSEQETQEFRDSLFRVQKKNGTWQEVDAPHLWGLYVADAHTHLQYTADPILALARATLNNVTSFCTVFDVHEDAQETFLDVPNWTFKAMALVPSLKRVCCGAPKPLAPRVIAACGCHPHNAKHYTPQLEAKLRSWLEQPFVAALGEIGLDYHYDFSPVEDQKRAFRAQLALAKELNLPAVLHVREAYDDAWEIVQEVGMPQAGMLLHCFTADWETLKPWIDAGCMVSFGGAITFGNADSIRDAAAHTPLEQLLLETDAPYMAPKPFRGMKCEPAHIIFTAKAMMDVRGIETEQDQRAFLQQICRNTTRFFSGGRQASIAVEMNRKTK